MWKTCAWTRVGLDTKELGEKDKATFASCVGSAIFCLSQDRADVKFAVKEPARQIRAPRMCDWQWTFKTRFLYMHFATAIGPGTVVRSFSLREQQWRSDLIRNQELQLQAQVKQN